MTTRWRATSQRSRIRWHSPNRRPQPRPATTRRRRGVSDRPTMPRTIVVALVAAAAVLAAGCGGSSAPTVDEFGRSVVSTRDRVDFALARITRAQSKDDLLGAWTRRRTPLTTRCATSRTSAPRAARRGSECARRCTRSACVRCPGDRRPDPPAGFQRFPRRHEGVELRELGRRESSVRCAGRAGDRSRALARH